MTPTEDSQLIAARADILFHQDQQELFGRIDWLFAGLLAFQWVAGIAISWWISPFAWAGVQSQTHPHVWAALLLGGAIVSLPIALVLTWPGRTITRQVIAIAQMLMGALLIHLTGGRIEMHFHVFGSLAFLAFYRDWRVLLTASAVVAVDHFVRGSFWPQSIFGLLSASRWRWLEHVGWVFFEDLFLFYSCVQGVRKTRRIAWQQAQQESTQAGIESTVQERTAQLHELTLSQASLAESARLATAVGDIGAALIRGDTLRETLDLCARALVTNLDAAFARVWTLNETQDVLELQASAGLYTHLVGPHSRVPVGKYKIGLIALERRPHLTNTVIGDPRVGDQDWARREGMVAFAGYPLLVEDRLVGVMALFARQSLSDATLQAMAAVADHVALGIKRKQTEEAQRLAEKKYRDIFDNALDGIFQTTPEGRYLSVNSALVRIYGYESAEELISRFTDIKLQLYVDPKRRDAFQCLMTEHNEVRAFESQVFRKDGSVIWISETGHTVRDASGRLLYYEGIIEEITDRKQLEDQFRQAQKMEAVGQLAGGVAHDFNNLLTVINGYSELMVTGLRQGDPHRDFAQGIRRAGERAASLTRQLLAFSRKQRLVPEVLNLNNLLKEMEKMLPRLIGEDIELKIACNPALGKVKADPGQVEQVIMNLVVNARDAMPGGGKLTIETIDVELDEGYAAANLEARAGPYVLLVVSDTGCGMDAATRARIFEPFFTTKGPDKGTGLGLAMIFGIVKQSGGFIKVYSEPGIGTTFKIYLPRVEQEAPTSKLPLPPKKLRQGGGTVLLVEDDDGVRGLSRLVLEKNGFHVLEARNGDEALLLGQNPKETFQILVTDVVMPRMSGPQLVKNLEPFRPNLKVLYLSGYTDEAILQHGIIGPETPFLHKPFTEGSLVNKVHEVLGAQAIPGGLLAG